MISPIFLVSPGLYFSHVKKNICLDCLTKTRSKLIQVTTPLFTILNTKGVRKLKCVMPFRKKNVTHLYSSFFLCLTKTFTSLKIKEYFLGHKALVPPCRHRVLHVFMHSGDELLSEMIQPLKTWYERMELLYRRNV